MTDFENLKLEIEKYVRSGMQEATRRQLIDKAGKMGINAGQLVMLIKNAELELKFATGASNTDYPDDLGSGFMTGSQQGTQSGFISESSDAAGIPVSAPAIDPVASSEFSEVRKLAQSGAMADIYSAIHLGRRKVIIKRIKPQFRNKPAYVDLFYKEFDNGYSLDNPNIVHFYGKGEDAEGPFYYMEYVDGRTLADFMKKENQRDPETIRKITLQLLEALKYMHQRQIYHRDLKPDNVMLTYKGNNVKIIDFGLAAADSQIDNLAKAGTPRYAAPELMSKASMVDGRSDIYSLGLMLIEMFTGNPDRHSLMDIPHEQYRAIADKCTMALPDYRYQSCDEIIPLLQSGSARPIPKWLEDKVKEYAADGFISRNERIVLNKEIARSGADKDLVEAMISDEIEKAINQKRKDEIRRRNEMAMQTSGNGKSSSGSQKGGAGRRILAILLGVLAAIGIYYAATYFLNRGPWATQGPAGNHNVVADTDEFGPGDFVYTTADVNLRQLATTESKVIKGYRRGTEVEVISVLYNWVEVKVDGKRGYMAKAYLAKK